MGLLVIACYRPKAGHEAALLDLLKVHVPLLRREGLATERAPVVGRTQDGTLVEIFEWSSAASLDEAHANPAVLQLWAHFGAVSDYVRLADLPESLGLFAHLVPVAVELGLDRPRATAPHALHAVATL